MESLEPAAERSPDHLLVVVSSSDQFRAEAVDFVDRLRRRSDARPGPLRFWSYTDSRDLDPAALPDFRAQVDAALGAARFGVALVTPGWCSSPDCRDEVKYMVHHKVPVVPVIQVPVQLADPRRGVAGDDLGPLADRQMLGVRGGRPWRDYRQLDPAQRDALALEVIQSLERARDRPRDR